MSSYYERIVSVRKVEKAEFVFAHLLKDKKNKCAIKLQNLDSRYVWFTYRVVRDNPRLSGELDIFVCTVYTKCGELSFSST